MKRRWVPEIKATHQNTNESGAEHQFVSFNWKRTQSLLTGTRCKAITTRAVSLLWPRINATVTDATKARTGGGGGQRKHESAFGARLQKTHIVCEFLWALFQMNSGDWACSVAACGRLTHSCTRCSAAVPLRRSHCILCSIRKLRLALQPVCLHLKATRRGHRRHHVRRHPTFLLFDPRGNEAEQSAVQQITDCSCSWGGQRIVAWFYLQHSANTGHLNSHEEESVYIKV